MFLYISLGNETVVQCNLHGNVCVLTSMIINLQVACDYVIKKVYRRLDRALQMSPNMLGCRKYTELGSLST